MQPLGRRPRHIPLWTTLLAVLLVGCESAPPPAATRPAAPATRPAAGAAASRPAVDRSVRVVLLRETAECVVAVHGPFEVVDAGRQRVLDTLAGSGSLTVSFADGRVQLAEIERSYDVGAVDLRPKGAGVVAVKVGEGLRPYRGWLRLVRRSPETGCVLNVVDVEDYLLGVVTAEMPAEFQPAALRAQAIAARTYAWYQKRFYGPTRDWDLQSNESSQMYRGEDAETGAALGAVRDTCGMVCTWTSPAGERVFPAYYSSTCGGVSRPAASGRGEPKWPVLAGDVACEFCAASPYFRWGPVSLPKKQIGERLCERYPRLAGVGPIAQVEIVERTARGRPLRVEIADDAGHREGLDVEDFRLTIDSTPRVLRSSHFNVAVREDAIVFSDGRGCGHGKGLCQYGANGLAKSGKTTEDILRFYYPGCHLVRAY